MKLKSLMITAVGAFSIATANAGDGKMVMTTGPVIEAAPTEIGATLSAGYDSTYVFRGIDLGEHAVWTGLDYTLPFAPIDIGAWYINPTEGGLDDDELDLYASVGQSFGAIDVWLGYTAYLYPESGAGTTNEVGAGVGTAVGPVDLGLAAYYDFDLEVLYFEGTVGSSIALTDIISLSLGAGIGYEVIDEGPEEFSHVDVRASLPIALTNTATLEPYIAGSISLDGREEFQDDILYGGVSLAVTF